jgi:DNA-binding NarL/FixJ family response regulator
MSGPCRVLVAERHPLYGLALDTALNQETDFVVVGRAEDGVETVEMAATTNPHVVVLDAGLPPAGGVHTCTQLKQSAPSLAVMVLDDEPRPRLLVAAIEAGADGYITRDVSRRAFVNAVRAVGHGEVSVPRALQAALVRGLRDRRRDGERIAQLYARLTRREREVLELIGRGMSNKRIARELGIAEKTVKTHVGHVLAKLGVSDRTQAALHAVRAGLVERS